MQEMAKSFPAMEAFTPEGFEQMMGTMPKDMMETMFGDGPEPEVVLMPGQAVADTCRFDDARCPKRNGRATNCASCSTRPARTEQHISETIGMMSVFAGMPAMTRAMDLAQSVMADNKDDET